MKKAVIIFILLLVAFNCNAQQQGQVYLNVLVPERKDIPAEAASHYENMLTQMLSKNGIASVDPSNRFVLSLKVDVLSKDILPTAPQRISEKLNLILMIGDAQENKVFETLSIPAIGVGINETKALIYAGKSIQRHSADVAGLIETAKAKIVNYYDARCEQIILEAKQYAASQDYDQALYLLTQVPDVCAKAKDCQQLAIQYYKERTDYEAAKLLNEAVAAWSSSPDQEGASAAADIISRIPAMTSSQKAVDKLCQQINNKLQGDERRAWEFKLRQYQDQIDKEKREYNLRVNQANAANQLRRQQIEASRQIGLAYAQHQPQTIIYRKNVILW